MADLIRASDAEREQAAGRLREHARAGRLNIAELTTRCATGVVGGAELPGRSAEWPAGAAAELEQVATVPEEC